ncbi:MAG: hypothetical protein CW346_18015 [Bacillaceae bacterium]|nr:hypothetical protein [Bacillaceae bacterium]
MRLRFFHFLKRAPFPMPSRAFRKARRIGGFWPKKPAHVPRPPATLRRRRAPRPSAGCSRTSFFFPAPLLSLSKRSAPSACDRPPLRHCPSQVSIPAAASRAFPPPAVFKGFSFLEKEKFGRVKNEKIRLQEREREMETIFYDALKTIGDETKLKNWRRVHGGDINEAFYLRTEQGEYFLKFRKNCPGRFFACERTGLEALRESGAVHVAKVYGYKD